MHYYIYPMGINARAISHSIELLNKTLGKIDTYSYIDDKKEGIGLADIKDKLNISLQNGSGMILVSSKKYLDNILENLQENGIKECFNGIELIAKRINCYFRKKYYESRIVGILLDGYEVGQKHLGNIPNLLKKNGYKVVYLIHPQNEWLLELEEKMLHDGWEYIYVTDEILEHLDFFSLLIFQNERLTKFNPRVSSLKLFVTAEQMSNQAVLPSANYAAFECLSNCLCDYINTHSVSLHKAMLERYENLNREISFNCGVFLGGGYPSIDNQIQEFVEQNSKRDSLIFVSSTTWYQKEMIDYVKEIIKKFIDDFRIVFKSHPIYSKREGFYNELNFKENFIGHSNFVYYTKARLSNDELNRSICLFTSTSSMGYSYPPIVKRPAILLYPIKSAVKDVYYNPKIHIKFYKDCNMIVDGGEGDNIKEVITKLSFDENYQKYWRDKIEHYCKEDMYHYGNASEYLVEWINQWYRKREILKRQN
ncbi:hypothetical protein [Helicobacter sp.]|uniref:hypothetical protein n=1 Tax=Helicobacter sp. TaxID=218 RepID=UPI002589BDE2|nr:hypothetical protein [Helicobacter sp.]MCI7047281.1 hypothetical protein [Helicobacter sp.]